MHTIKDANNINKNFKSSTDGDELVPHVKIDSPSPLATEAKQDEIINKLIEGPATEQKQNDVIAALVAILTKLIAAPATEAKQDALIQTLADLNSRDFATQTTLAAVLAKLITAPATEAKQDALIAKDFATQTTLAAVLAKLIAAPATEAKQDALIAKDFATQTTLAALNSKDFATQTTLAAVLAKLIAAPATEAKQDALIAKDFATQTTLAALLAAFKAEDSASVSGDLGLIALGMRQLADTTSTDNDGDYTIIKLDEEGRVKVATKPASFILIQGVISANAQTVFCDVSRASNVMIAMVATSLVGHNVTFEGSIDSTNGTDGTYFGIQVTRSNANIIETTSGVLASTPAYAWEASVNGLTFIRVRATAHTSGSATWKFQRGSYATEPIPAAQVSATQPVSHSGALAAGTNLIGDVGMQVRNNATGAASKFHLVSAANTNASIVKNSSGRLLSWRITNTNAAFRYVKLHNIATAPTAGAGVVETIAVPPNSVVTGNIPQGSAFTTGIGMTTTTGAADNDTNAVAAGDLIIDLYFA